MISEFPLHAADMGFRVTGPLVADGKIHRANWKPSRPHSYKATWYVVFGDETYSTVVWGDYQDGFRDVWSSKAGNRMTSAERAAFKAHTAAVREQEERDRRAAADSARRRAWAMWCDAEVEIGPHDYLTRKQIGPEYLRARTHDGRVELLVPLRDGSGELCNLQRIWPDGTKRFVKNAGVAGLHWRTGPMPDEDFTGDVAITEGVATAGTVRRLAGVTVFAAIAANNLVAVTSWVRKRLPMARILIAADDDRWEKDGTARPLEKNIGRVKSMEAAEGTRALVLFPTFSDLQNRGTDWNDLWCDEGEPMARNRWTSAVTIAALDRQVALMSDVEYNRRRAELQTAYRSAGANTMGPRELDRRRREGRGAGNGVEADPNRPPIMDLMSIVDEYELWHDQFGVAYVTMENGGTWMNAQVESQVFDDWLRTQYEETTANETPLIPQTVKNMVIHAASKARTRGECHQSHFRVAKCGGYRWLDLGRRDWKCVRWNADGWEIVDSAAAKFFRGETNIGLPLPVRNPELNGLDPFWNIINTAPENRPLIAGFILGALKSDTPCFGLALQGEQGSAKSVATELIRRLIDPTTAPFQRLNDVKPEDFGITCISQLIPCFDNVSHIDPDMQDTLCSLTTGLGFKTRKLYTNSDVVSCWVRRPWIINGITNVCTRSDLAERSIPVHLNVIDKSTRKTEDEVRSEFAAIHPHLLAVILDAAVEAEKHWEAAGEAIRKSGLSHRMADALQWITAGEDALGFVGGTFLSRLNSLQEESGVEALEGTPMMETIEALLSDSNSRGEWAGTSSEILAKLDEFAPTRTRPKYLPHDDKSLGNWFKRERPRLLRSFGIKVSDPIQDRKWGDWKKRRIITRGEIPQQIEF